MLENENFLEPKFTTGDFVVIRREQGGRPNDGYFSVVDAGCPDRWGNRYYLVRPQRGRDQVVSDKELVRLDRTDLSPEK
jgi:hypothetical protein